MQHMFVGRTIEEAVAKAVRPWSGRIEIKGDDCLRLRQDILDILGQQDQIATEIENVKYKIERARSNAQSDRDQARSDDLTGMLASLGSALASAGALGAALRGARYGALFGGAGAAVGAATAVALYLNAARLEAASRIDDDITEDFERRLAELERRQRRVIDSLNQTFREWERLGCGQG